MPTCSKNTIFTEHLVSAEYFKEGESLLDCLFDHLESQGSVQSVSHLVEVYSLPSPRPFMDHIRGTPMPSGQWEVLAGNWGRQKGKQWLLL